MDNNLFQEYFDYLNFSGNTQLRYYDSHGGGPDERLFSADCLSEKLSALVCSVTQPPLGIDERPPCWRRSLIAKLDRQQQSVLFEISVLSYLPSTSVFTLADGASMQRFNRYCKIYFVKREKGGLRPYPQSTSLPPSLCASTFREQWPIRTFHWIRGRYKWWGTQSYMYVHPRQTLQWVLSWTDFSERTSHCSTVSTLAAEKLLLPPPVKTQWPLDHLPVDWSGRNPDRQFNRELTPPQTTATAFSHPYLHSCRELWSQNRKMAGKPGPLHRWHGEAHWHDRVSNRRLRRYRRQLWAPHERSAHRKYKSYLARLHDKLRASFEHFRRRDDGALRTATDRKRIDSLVVERAYPAGPRNSVQSEGLRIPPVPGERLTTACSDSNQHCEMILIVYDVDRLSTSLMSHSCTANSRSVTTESTCPSPKIHAASPEQHSRIVKPWRLSQS